MRILILDDSTDLLYGLQRILTMYDHAVRSVKDTESFLKELDSFQPEVALIDVLLGQVDGREVCKRIRENDIYKNITLILFSGNPKNLTNYQEFGADGAVEKPFDMSGLIHQIKSAVYNRKQQLLKA